MNYVELLNKIKTIALSNKYINSFYDVDVYDEWNSSNVKYGSLAVNLESVTNSGQTITYSVVMYYGDRLLQDNSNYKELYTDGLRAVQSVINALIKDGTMINDDEVIQYNPLNQKFADYLGGVWTRVDIEVDNELGYCDIDDFAPTPPTPPEPFDIEGYTFVEGTVLYSAAALTKKDKILSINDTTITEIGDGGYAFAGCKLVETITLPNLTHMAGSYNFYTLSNLREVNLPALTAQGDGAFTYYACTNLKKVNLPNLITLSSSGSMFNGCTNLLEINVPKLSNTFGSSALTGCNKLRKLDITSSNNFPSLPTGFTDLIEVHFGAGQYLNMALNLSRWNPTNAYLTDSQSLLTPEDIQAGFTSNAEKLYYNLQHYFADLLPNRTGSGAGSMTLNADMKNFINAQIGLGVKSTIENKNWTIA